jgi:hypothetical protein
MLQASFIAGIDDACSAKGKKNCFEFQSGAPLS